MTLRLIGLAMDVHDGQKNPVNHKSKLWFNYSSDKKKRNHLVIVFKKLMTTMIWLNFQVRKSF